MSFSLILSKQSVSLILNDHIDIAIAFADGVHLGQGDLPLRIAQKIAPNNFIIGITCHTVEQAQVAQNDGATYIAIGCLFYTTTKKDTIPISLTELNKIIDILEIPACVIGGIQVNNIDRITNLKPQMYAIQSAIWETQNPIQAIQMLQEKIYHL